jgi:ADP-ribosyl-[dinitrogen reductase] hydrolase
MNSFPNSNGPDRLLNQFTRPKNIRLLENFPKYFQNSIEERSFGCLLGLAVGDVLGCPLEGMSYQTIKTRHPEGVQGLIFPSFWHNWRLPGLHSDDTQQALVLIDAFRRQQLIQPGEWDANAHFEFACSVANVFIKGLEINSDLPFGCWRGTGKGFRRVVERLSRNRQNDRWPYGYGEYSAGLGAAMRVSPLGVLVEDIDQVKKMVEHISFMTHTNPTAVVCACAAAIACHLLSKKLPGTLQTSVFLSCLIDEVAHIEKELTRHGDFEQTLPSDDKTVFLLTPLIEEVKKIIHLAPEAALKAIADKTEKLTGQRIIPTAGYAPSGIAACLYFFLHDLENPEKALLTTINYGGDADTTGAIVGAMCGAFYGPFVFKNHLENLLALDLLLDISHNCFAENETCTIDLIKTECLHTEIEELARTLYLKIY